MMCHAGFGGVDALTNEYSCFLETFGGGYGGRARERRPRRGADARPEHRERARRGDRAELPGARDAALARRGLGRRRAASRRARAAQGLPLRPADDFTVLADRTLRGPAGALGGQDGKVAEYVLIRDGDETRLPAKTTFDARPGDTISYRTCGGGGYGPPAERDPARVARDVREGKVSAGAREVYGGRGVS